MVGVASAGRCAPGTSLGRRFVAAWPGWLILALAAAAAVVARPLGGFWAGFGGAGAVAFTSTVVLTALGVVATSDAPSDAAGD